MNNLAKTYDVFGFRNTISAKSHFCSYKIDHSKIINKKYKQKL